MTTENLHVIARIQVKSDAVESLRQALHELAVATRKETGCVSYRLFQNQNNSLEFTTVEEWVSAAAEAAHMTTPHVRKAIPVLQAALVGAPDMQRYRELA